MMEDWTDIIGEELENIEEPLPADDWGVLQQKYAAAQRRKKAAAFAWAGGITSVAAAVALVLLLVRPDTASIVLDQFDGPDDLVAETLPPVEESVPVDTAAVMTLTDTLSGVASPVHKEKSEPVSVARKMKDDVRLAKSTTVEVSSDKTEEMFDVIRDTTSMMGGLLADAGDVMENSAHSASEADNRKSEGESVSVQVEGVEGQPTGIFGFEEFPEERPRRNIRVVSVGVSGSVSDVPVFGLMSFDSYEPMLPEQNFGNLEDPGYTDNEPVRPEEPSDTLGVKALSAPKTAMRSKTGYTDSYNHDIPVSFGISARIYLADKVSINTGLNYTRYTSTRTRRYDVTFKKQSDKQYVHYLGIPVRLDWMAVDRKHFGFYLGAGAQMDKCIYATVAGERLHEKQVLFGLNGAMGVQVNIVPLVGLYLEPEVSDALNEGTLETFRYDNRFVITFRGGLRFNF